MAADCDPVANPYCLRCRTGFEFHSHSNHGMQHGWLAEECARTKRQVTVRNRWERLSLEEQERLLGIDV